MENRYSVSVILPVYNTASTLYDCLKSINDQKLKLELIFVNDGSTDGSLKVFKDFNFRDTISIKVINRVNKGFLTSLNEAVELSSGKYIARIDGDDIWANNHLKNIITEFKKNHDYVLIGSQCFFINNFKKIIGHSKLPMNHKNIIKYFHKDNPFIHSSVVFSREAYFKTGGYYRGSDPFYSHIADFNLWFELSKHGLCKNMKQKSVYYRVSEKSMSRTMDKIINLKSRLFVMSNVNNYYQSYIYYYMLQKFKVLMQIIFNKLIK